jgi:hypothetical protein
MTISVFSKNTPLLFATLLLVALAAGCGGGGGGGSAGGTGIPAGAIVPGASCTAAAGATIPTVTSSSPTSGNLMVATSTTGVANSGKLITATFSLAMDPTTINSATPGTNLTFTIKNNTTAGSNVAGTVLLDATAKIATFTTSAALPANSSYTAVITVAAKSAAGTAMGCAYAWNFSTGAVATSLAQTNLGLADTFGMAATAGLTNTPTAPLTHIEGDVVLVSTITCNAVAVPGGPGTSGFGNCGAPPPKAPTLNGTVVTPSVPNGATTSAAVMADFTAGFNSTCFPGRPVAACSHAGGLVIGAIGGVAGSALVPNVNYFTPGVYTSATTIDITGDLTLDALGDPDAVFIFQAGSALNVAAGAAPPMVVAPPSGIHTRILLVNGAKASNVWWSVGSTATLGLFSEFQGNVLAYTTIIMNTGATACGRMLAGASGAGQLTFDSNIVSVPGRPFVPPASYSTVCQ